MGKIRLAIFWTVLLASLPVLAQTPPTPDLSAAKRLQQQQQQLIEDEIRRRAVQEALERPTPASAIGVPQAPPTPPKPEITGPCVDIKEIKFSGNTKVSSWRIRRIASGYQNRCLTVDEINRFLNDVTNVYIGRGYITSRAFMIMPQMYLKEGILEIKIIEGRVAEVTGLPLGKHLTAFPLIHSGVLNLRDFEQGLDQMNRLGSNKATMEIAAAPRDDATSIVNIAVERGDRANWSVFTDNLGSKSTGELRAGGRISYDNPLGLNDQVNLMFTNSLPDDFDLRNSTSAIFGYNLPIGWWTLSNNFSYSRFKTSFPLPISGTPFYTLGNTVTNAFSVDRVLSRGQRYKVSAAAGITYKDTNNFTRVLDLHMKNESSSRVLTVVNLDLPFTLYFSSGMLYAKPGFVKGTRLFGAFSDLQSPYSQKAQYEAYKLYAFSNWRFGPVAWSTSVDSQYSNDELFSSEAFYMGGESTVRGFKNEGVQGDSGFSIRNDLSFNLPSLLESQNRWLGAFTPSVFVDYGRVFPNAKPGPLHPMLSDNDVKSKTLAGTGAKIAFNYWIFEASATYSWILYKEPWMNEKSAAYLYAGIKSSF